MRTLAAAMMSCVLAACGNNSGGGLRPDTASCATSAQCESGYCAFPKMANVVAPICGTCEPVGVADNGACSSTMPCIQGDSCAGGTCVPEATPGQTCDATQTTAPRCGPHLRCDTTSHTCVALTGNNCGNTPPDGQFVECAPTETCVTTEGGNFCMARSGSGSCS